MKDYTYGVDSRAKDVHMHRFINNGKKNQNHETSNSRNDMSNGFINEFSNGSINSLKPSNCQSCGARGNSPSLVGLNHKH